MLHAVQFQPDTNYLLSTLAQSDTLALARSLDSLLGLLLVDSSIEFCHFVFSHCASKLPLSRSPFYRKRKTGDTHNKHTKANSLHKREEKTPNHDSEFIIFIVPSDYPVGKAVLHFKSVQAFEQDGDSISGIFCFYIIVIDLVGS